MAQQYTLDQYAALVNKALDQYVTEKEDLLQNTIFKAMRYTLEAGGKRVRAALLLAFYRTCAGETAEITDVMPFACAVEMIHAYSLIHDDLPCMDNDDYRRGKLTCHKVFGEAMAVLAGDALLNGAFELMLQKADLTRLPITRVYQAIATLARASGALGMIGGQVIDLEHEHVKVDYATLSAMHERKTGALLTAPCVMGCILAGADERKQQAAAHYGANIGVAFQVIDDILDVTGDFAVLGKATGSDEKQEKSTFVTLFGIEKSRKMAADFTNEAVNALQVFTDHTFLTGFAKSLLSREK